MSAGDLNSDDVRAGDVNSDSVTSDGVHGAGRTLEPRQAALVDAAAAVAASDWEELARVFDRAAVSGSEDALEEILLQSYLFLGYPRALTALELWRTHSARAAPFPVRDDLERWTDRGVRICREVYGAAYEKLRERARWIHPDLDRWMVSEGYGKVLGRPGASIVDRELAAVAMLIVLNSPPQLHSHLRGALSVGATEEIVSEVVERTCEPLSADRSVETAAIWSEVRTRWRGSGAPREVR